MKKTVKIESVHNYLVTLFNLLFNRVSIHYIHFSYIRNQIVIYPFFKIAVGPLYMLVYEIILVTMKSNILIHINKMIFTTK